MHIRNLIPVLTLAAAVLAAPAAASASTAPALSPATAKPGISIYGACNAFEDGRVLVVRGLRYECVYIRGLGWFFVRYSNSCPGGVSDKPARTC